MRVVETLISITLSLVLIYFFVELSFLSILKVNLNPLSQTPAVNAIFFFICFLAAVLASLHFPSWNVFRTKGKNDFQYTNKYISNYKKKFSSIAIAYLGLILWCFSSNFMDIFWILKAATILFSIYHILSLENLKKI